MESKLRRSRAHLAGWLVTVMLIVACTGTGSTPGSQAQSSAPSNAADAEALLAAAKREGKVVWYSAQPIQSAQEMAADFQRQTGIEVVVERIAGTTGTTRFAQENAAGKPQADILQSSDVAGLTELYARKMLVDYKPPTYDRIAASNRIGDYAYGAYLVDIAAIVNTNLVSATDAEKLRTWQGLVDPKWKGKIATVEPYLGGARFSSWMYVLYPDRGVLADNKTFAPVTTKPDTLGIDFLKKFAALEPAIFSDLNAAADAVAKGQYALMYPYFEGGSAPLLKAGAPVRWYFPDPCICSTNTYNTISASAPHPNAARVFFNWLMGEAGTKSQLERAGNRTVLQGVEDTRPFVTQPWYKMPARAWGPNQALYDESLKAGSVVWDATVKPSARK